MPWAQVGDSDRGRDEIVDENDSCTEHLREASRFDRPGKLGDSRAAIAHGARDAKSGAPRRPPPLEKPLQDLLEAPEGGALEAFLVKHGEPLVSDLEDRERGLGASDVTR